MSWNERWMQLAELVGSWSKDRSTKVGCVIVDERNNLVSLGWNGFPRGIDDDRVCRHERPLKYNFTEHAERNAIYNAAASGIKLLGCIMYLPWFPCTDCARAIIQSGIRQIICYKPNLKDERWGEDFKISREMLTEARIEQMYIDA